jgi:mutator protein MutT
MMKKLLKGIRESFSNPINIVDGENHILSDKDIVRIKLSGAVDQVKGISQEILTAQIDYDEAIQELGQTLAISKGEDQARVARRIVSTQDESLQGISDLLIKLEESKEVLKGAEQDVIDYGVHIKEEDPTEESISKAVTQEEIERLAKKTKKKDPKKKHSVAAIIKDSEGRILFLKRAMDDTLAPSTWCLPGGGIDGGETPEEAVIREVKEESNLDIAHCWKTEKISVDDVVICYYECIVKEDTMDVALLDNESDHYAWWSVKDRKHQELTLDLESHLNYIENRYEYADDIGKSELLEDVERDLIKANQWARPISIDEEKMNLEDHMLATLDIAKSLDTSKLVAKKVQITRKDGKTYYATRYVHQDSGESFPLHSVKIDVGKEDSSLAKLVENSELSKTEKIKGLINLGVYDKQLLSQLAGAEPTHVYTYMRKVGLTSDVLKSIENDEPVPSAKVNHQTEEVEFDTETKHSDIEQTIAALLEADGLDFDDEDIHKINSITGKDAVDTVQDKFTDMVAKKERKLAMFYGTGGVGKTYGVKKILSDPETVNGDTGDPFGNKLVEYDSELSPSAEQYDYIKFTGKITPSKMFRALYEHNGKVILLDDADSVLLDEDSVNILKAATDTTLEDVVWDGGNIKGSDGESKLPTRFKFTGGVIIISNLSEKKLKQVASPLLESRALSLDVSRTMEETVDKLDRIKDVLPFEDRDGEPIEVGKEHKAAAINFIKKYQNHMPVTQVNGRTLGALALLHIRGRYKNEAQWFGDHAARSLMNVKREQIIDFHKKRLAQEAKVRKEQQILFKSVR